MKSEKPFYIVGSRAGNPFSRCTVYVDGTGGKDFREGIDIELSHWPSNRTPDQYKAGTSTDICFKFLEDRNSDSYDLVVNNHIDIDGLLSVFVMAYPYIAMRYRDILTDAAKTGDFWGWCEGKALKVFQDVTLLYQDLQRQSIDLKEVYEQCFQLILHILESREEKSEAQTILEDQSLLIERGHIQRHEITPRLVAYFMRGKGSRFFHMPCFNEPISQRLALWPQVRNRLDAEKVQLVAIKTDQGMHYDLWYPGYVWAETKGLWRPKGVGLPKTPGGFQVLDWPDLSALMQEFNRLEEKGCRWQVFPGLCFSRQENLRGLPVVATTLASPEGHQSSLSLGMVKPLFKRLFESL